jgi:hypothetical protein
LLPVMWLSPSQGIGIGMRFSGGCKPALTKIPWYPSIHLVMRVDLNRII